MGPADVPVDSNSQEKDIAAKVTHKATPAPIIVISGFPEFAISAAKRERSGERRECKLTAYVIVELRGRGQPDNVGRNG